MANKEKIHRVMLLLTDDQYNFVKKDAESLGLSISKFIRLVIISIMSNSNIRKGVKK